MVHVRLNEREANPNPHINFISALPAADEASREEARQLLRALAAQVRPVMKAHGFAVNSLEEYEYNKVFAGRNWNNGEVVELVLRNANGQYVPVSWLLSTLCHELAHIQHMNHGPAFQALWAKLRQEVRELQNKGYYGDGYWSSGTRLADSARVGTYGISAEGLPEYMCGGAHSRKRPTALRRKRGTQQAGPSNHTGPQTAKRRKAGSRVTAKAAFKGEGTALNADIEDEDRKKAGTGFGKKAGSKRAREERALAAERRLLALQGRAGPSTAPPSPEREDESGADDSGDEGPRETDQDRRRTMLEAMGQSDLEDLKTTRTDYSDEFVFPSPASRDSGSTPPSGRQRPSRHELEVVSDSSELDRAVAGLSCDVQTASQAGPTATSSATENQGSSVGTRGTQSVKGKATDARPSQTGLGDSLDPGNATDVPKKNKVSYGNIVKSEMHLRKKESIGLAAGGGGRRLGGGFSHISRNAQPSQATNLSADYGSGDRRGEVEDWACLVCTLSNLPGNLACSACGTPRGESNWSGAP
ncbi:WLM-domain-containing protein [Obba rivulosa]|uniref:WLM-domain-containing protein n=1 Tax=Obba rivulosa TaxID=1052685 RepID=A0A8E2DT64_9APHY|nr:WLM-domain-containing protein [Obba rivulosa]